MASFSVAEIEVTTGWFRFAMQFTEVSEHLVNMLSHHFPNKAVFELTVPSLKLIAISALGEEEKEILEKTELILNKKYKSNEEKALMVHRAKIVRKINRSISRL